MKTPLQDDVLGSFSTVTKMWLLSYYRFFPATRADPPITSYTDLHSINATYVRAITSIYRKCFDQTKANECGMLHHSPYFFLWEISGPNPDVVDTYSDASLTWTWRISLNGGGGGLLTLLDLYPLRTAIGRGVIAVVVTMYLFTTEILSVRTETVWQLDRSGPQQERTGVIKACVSKS